jgi:hypothetical protein
MREYIYFFDWTIQMDEYLTTKGYTFYVSDADIIRIKLNGWNDNVFVNLLLDFSCWLIENANDMSINPCGNGALYHSSK